MLKTILWIAAACVAILVALAVSRTMGLGETAAPPPVAPPAVVEQLPPPPVAAPAPEPVPDLQPPPTPDEQQIQDDAAATGMTTVEPEESAPQDHPT